MSSNSEALGSPGPAKHVVPPGAAALGRRALHGLMWMLAQNVAARACSVLSQLALAALLSPADFGVIGLAYTVTSIVAVLTNLGIEDVVLQRRRGMRFWTGPAFWMSVGLAMAAALVVVALSPFAAALYRAPQLVGILGVLALAMPLGSFSVVPGMMMRARMRFGVLAAYGTVEMIAQAALTVGFAWAGFGAYSFVLPAPILAVARTVMWWRLAGPGTGLRPHLKRWKHVVGNTAALSVTRIVVACINQGDYVVLGVMASQHVVGAYYFGFRLAAQPLWMLAGNLSGVLFPMLVQLKSDPERQRSAALKASTMLSYCVMPVALLQAAVAQPFVSSLFGDKWTMSIPVIQLLSVGLALDSVSWVAQALLNARGEYKRVMRAVLIQAPVFFALVTIGAALDQGVGVAWAVCVFYATTQPLFVYRAYRTVGIKLSQVAMIYLKPSALAACAVGLGAAVSLLPVVRDLPLARVFVIGLVGTVVYAGLVGRFAPDIWQEVRDRLFKALRRTVPAN